MGEKVSTSAVSRVASVKRSVGLSRRGQLYQLRSELESEDGFNASDTSLLAHANTDTGTGTDTPYRCNEFSFSVKAATCSLSSLSSLAILGRRLI